MQQSGYQWPGQQQPGNWAPAPQAAPEPVRDCAALVLDGVWPYELMHPRPETEHLARQMDRDLRKIVERTNEKLAELAQLNLAPAEYRASEERFIRTAKAMAVLRVESTVRQLGGRSILGTQGMPSLTAPPIQHRRAANDPLETTQVVSPEVIAQAKRMAQQRQAEVEQTRIVPVVSPPYLAESPADVEQTVVFARHRVERPEAPPAAVEDAPDPAPAEPVIIDQVEEQPERPRVEVIDAGVSALSPRPQHFGSYSRSAPVDDAAIERDGTTTEPVAPRREYRGERVGQWPNPEGLAGGRHRDPAESQADAEIPGDRSERQRSMFDSGQTATPVARYETPEDVRLAAPESRSREPLRESAADAGFSPRMFSQDAPGRPDSSPLSREPVQPLRFGEPSLLPVPPARPVNGSERVPANGHEPAPSVRPEPPAPRPSRPLALEQPVSLQQMVGSLARQQPSLKWLVAERTDGTKVAVCEVMSGWIPPGITLPVGVSVLPPEQRSGPMSGWVGSVANSALYGPGNRIEGRNVPSVAGEEAFAVVDIAEDLGERIAEATNRPGLPRITNTLVRAAVSGSGVLPAELDVLNVHLETAVQMLLAEAPDVNAEEAVSCMLMGAAAAIAAGRARLAAYHYGWFEAIAGRR